MVIGGVRIVVVCFLVALLHAVVCARGNGKVARVPPRLHKADLNHKFISFIKQRDPDFEFNTIEGPNGPVLEMPLNYCKNSMDCHNKFTNYLGTLFRMIETGKRK